MLAIVFSACAESAAQERRTTSSEGAAIRLELRTVVPGDQHDFGRIGAITADRDGRIYVADVHESANEIMVLDRQGRRVGTIGRPGSGPGEFRRLMPTLGWFGDTLVAMDAPTHRRISMFERSGRHVLTATLEGGAVANFLFSARGNPYFLQITRRVLMPPDLQRPEPEIPVPVAKYSRVTRTGTLVPVDALSDSADAVGGWGSSQLCRSRDKRATRGMQFPFSDRGPLRAFTAAGQLAKAHAQLYRIDVLDPRTGSTTQTIRRNVARLPMRDADWEALPEIRAVRRFEQQYGGPLLGLGEKRCPLYDMRPDSLPAVRTLIIDDADRFWVETTRRTGFGLDMFDRSGRFLGETTMPERDRNVAPYARGNFLYIVTVDDLDVQSIHVYELITAG